MVIFAHHGRYGRQMTHRDDSYEKRHEHSALASWSGGDIDKATNKIMSVKSF
jgi:hypothetical protein